MGLKCGIIGLPNVGKSTLFSALSNTKAEVANYPFCTIEPNVSIITVPDNRLVILEQLVKPQKVIPTVIEFVDIAGLVKGASKGEGLGNQFLTNIREVDAIIHVVRSFEDENITHVSGTVDPIDDMEVINTELQLKDLEIVEKRIQKVEKVAKSGDKDAKAEYDILSIIKSHLSEGKDVRRLEIEEELQKQWVTPLQLLTSKPIIYVANVDEESVRSGNKFEEQLQDALQQEDTLLLTVSAELERQIAEFEDQEEKLLLLEEYGLTESGLDRLIRGSYELLNLITFFTAGEKEVRAWTIVKGWKAPQAAGVIHSDFEKGFIRAEVIKMEDYEKYGSESACKEAGKLSIEGKDYVMQNGDIIHFRFNV